MSMYSGSISEEQSLFRPFTRDSLIELDKRIEEECLRQKELEKKRAEGEVCTFWYFSLDEFEFNKSVQTKIKALLLISKLLQLNNNKNSNALLKKQ